MSSILPGGLIERPATMDDIDIIYRLSHAHDIAQYGEEEFTREDLQIRFSEAGINRAQETITNEKELRAGAELSTQALAV